jgi:hypothetical protein
MTPTNDQIQRLKEKASNPKEREPKVKRLSDLTPLVHVPKGTTLARFYMDREGEAVRTILVHQHEGALVPCIGDGCEICAYLADVADFGSKWKFEVTEKSIAYATIFDYQGSDGEYVKKNIPVVLMGNWRLRKDIYDLLGGLDVEDIGDLFNPKARSALWVIKKESKSFSCGLHVKRATMDLLPDHIAPLSQCFFVDGSVPSREEINGFVEKIRKASGKAVSLERSPEDTAAPASDSAQAKESADKTGDDLPQVPGANVQTDQGDEQPETDKEKKDCFGQHPDGQNPTCLLCDNEDDCLEATDQ